MLALFALALAVAPPALKVEGTVVFQNGVSLEGALVFAVDAGTLDLVTAARSDHDGRVSLTTERGRTVLIGVTMRSFELAALQVEARDRFRAILRAPPAELRSGKALAAALAADRTVELVSGAPAGVVQGTLRDDVGAALPAARVAAFEEGGHDPVGTTPTDARGRFSLVLPPGRYHVVPLAPGLKPLRVDHPRPGQVAVTMTIDAAPETIQVVVGAEVLSFRMQDSIWPEYYPPPPVKAWLKHRYCLDVNRMVNKAGLSSRPPNVGPPPVRPGRGNLEMWPRPDPPPLPLSVAVRRLNLPRYWWLKKLYTTPPNPARCQ